MKKIIKILAFNMLLLLIGLPCLSQTSKIQKLLLEVHELDQRQSLVDSLVKCNEPNAEEAFVDLSAHKQEVFPYLRQQFAKALKPYFELSYVVNSEDDVLNIYSTKFDNDGSHQIFMNTWSQYLIKLRFAYVKLTGSKKEIGFALRSKADGN